MSAEQCASKTPEKNIPQLLPKEFCDSSKMDSPIVQATHEKAYDGLRSAFDKLNNEALGAWLSGGTGTSVNTALVTRVKAAMTAVSTMPSDATWHQMIMKFATTLSNGTKYNYRYTDPWTAPAGTTATSPEYFGSYLQYTLTKALDPANRPAGNNPVDERSAIIDPTARDANGNLIQPPPPMNIGLQFGVVDKIVMLPHDFHVMRLAQSAAFQTVFSLAMGCIKADMATSTNDNFDTVKLTMNNCAQMLTTIEGKITFAPGVNSQGKSQMAAFSILLKSMSEKNIERTQDLKRLKEQIDMRRTNLQTALSAEMNIDKIVRWSHVYWWIWLFLFIGGITFIAWAMLSGTTVLIYIIAAVLLLVQALVWILRWFGYDLMVWDIGSLRDSMSLALGNISRLSF